MTHLQADELQAEVAAWYQRFKLARQQHVAGAIRPALALDPAAASEVGGWVTTPLPASQAMTIYQPLLLLTHPRHLYGTPS